ncbi:MAG: hypothetical protein HYR84_02600 [Planctomycetes bacterium]|nr:hypothetical protein [Planctomycetota bacterium]
MEYGRIGAAFRQIVDGLTGVTWKEPAETLADRLAVLLCYAARDADVWSVYSRSTESIKDFADSVSRCYPENSKERQRWTAIGSSIGRAGKNQDRRGVAETLALLVAAMHEAHGRGDAQFSDENYQAIVGGNKSIHGPAYSLLSALRVSLRRIGLDLRTEVPAAGSERSRHDGDSMIFGERHCVQCNTANDGRIYPLRECVSSQEAETEAIKFALLYESVGIDLGCPNCAMRLGISDETMRKRRTPHGKASESEGCFKTSAMILVAIGISGLLALIFVFENLW